MIFGLYQDRITRVCRRSSFRLGAYVCIPLILIMASPVFAEDSNLIRVVVPDALGSPRWGVASLTRSLRRELISDHVSVLSAIPYEEALRKLGFTGGQKLKKENMAEACRKIDAQYVLRVIVTKKGWLYRARTHLIECSTAAFKMDFTSGYYKPTEETTDRGQRIGKTVLKTLAKLQSAPSPSKPTPDLELAPPQRPLKTTTATSTPIAEVADPFEQAFDSALSDEDFDTTDLETPGGNLEDNGLEDTWQHSGHFEARHYAFLHNTSLLNEKDKNLFTLGFRGAIDGSFGTAFRVRVLPVVMVDVVNQRLFRTAVEEAFVEASWDWLELRLGWDALTWGSASIINVIDIINPRDYTEGLLDSEKIGQPMLSAKWIFGDHFLRLYYFSPFVDPVIARLDSAFFPFPLPLDKPIPSVVDGQIQSDIILGSELEEWTPEVAARLSLTFGNVDLNTSYFYGYSRFPLINPRRLELFYPLLHQASVDGQLLATNLLLKWEIAYTHFVENNRSKSYNIILPEDRISWAIGLEQTIEGFWNGTTITPVVELIGDSDSTWFTDDRPPDDFTRLFQNHFAIALKWSLENQVNSEIKFLDLMDLSRPEEHILTLEYSQRLYRSFLIILGGRFVNAEKDSKTISLEQLTGVYSKLRINY